MENYGYQVITIRLTADFEVLWQRRFNHLLPFIQYLTYRANKEVLHEYVEHQKVNDRKGYIPNVYI